MSGISSGKLQRLIPLIDGLIALAQDTARATRQFSYSQRRRRYVTLRPGTDTPLWDELVQTARRYLRKRGEKVKLARFLGVPRQRLHLLLVAKTRCPDAERTLLLLAWVAARAQGRRLS